MNLLAWLFAPVIVAALVVLFPPILVVVGPALIAGGLVPYRSTDTRTRAFAASATTAGIMIVLLVVFFLLFLTRADSEFMQVGRDSGIDVCACPAAPYPWKINDPSSCSVL